LCARGYRSVRAPRWGWLGVAAAMAALALLGLALRKDPFRLWPVIHLASVETWSHAVAAAVALAGATLLPAAWGARAGRAAALALLAFAGVAALSPSLVAMAPRAGAVVEPAQAIAYALSGAWLLACVKKPSGGPSWRRPSFRRQHP
jgi:hypothetical protein